MDRANIARQMTKSSAPNVLLDYDQAKGAKGIAMGEVIAEGRDGLNP